MPDHTSVCRPCKQQESQYYQCVQHHFEGFEQLYDERFSAKYGFFRPYVKQVIYRYLYYDILHNRFPCVKPKDCNHEYLLPSPANAAEIAKQRQRGEAFFPSELALFFSVFKREKWVNL